MASIEVLKKFFNRNIFFSIKKIILILFENIPKGNASSNSKQKLILICFSKLLIIFFKLILSLILISLPFITIILLDKYYLLRNISSDLYSLEFFLISILFTYIYLKLRGNIEK